MLKFTDHAPVFDVDEACVVFNGVNAQGSVTCHVTASAIQQRAGLVPGLMDDDAAKLLAAFTRHRQFFEDIACVLNMRGAESAVTVDETHLHESAFASWQPYGTLQGRTRPARSNVVLHNAIAG